MNKEFLTGFVGVVVGGGITFFFNSIHHWHNQRTDIIKRLLAFYRSRIESFEEIEGTLAKEFGEQNLEKSRAPLRAEMLLYVNQPVLDIEQELFEHLKYREIQRAMKMSQFKTTGSQVSNRIGIGSYENMTMDLEELKHAKKIFDEIYEKFVNCLRSEVSYFKTFEFALTEIEPLPQISEFSYLNPLYQIRNRVQKDPESVENIWRARISDKMILDGDDAFDANAYREESFRLNDENSYGLSFKPQTPDHKFEGNKPVPGCLGYDHLYIYSIETLIKAKQDIEIYFQKVPQGKIILKKRQAKGSRNWIDIMECAASKKQDLHGCFDKLYGDSLQKSRQYKSDEEKRWASVLIKAKKPIPAKSN
jgi:hypothetical protein